MYLANLVDNVLVIKCDESKSPVAVCYLVVGQHCLLDFAELLEVGLDILQTGSSAQATHKNLFGSHHKFWIGLPRNGDLFSGDIKSI